MKGMRGLLVALVLAVGVAACGGGADTGAEPEAAATAASEATSEAASTVEEPASEESAGGAYGESSGSSEPAAAGATTVTTADTDLGTVLVDGEGRTLYRFLNDSEGTSSCAEDCLANWPLLPAEGAQASEGADASLLGTLDRPEGAQVTYAQWPLYYYAGDQAPGDLNGQGVGDVWYVVAPDGSVIQDAG